MTETISEVFGSLISDLADQGYSTRSELVALPYDWRLPMHQLEQRDGFVFHRLLPNDHPFPVSPRHTPIVRWAFFHASWSFDSLVIDRTGSFFMDMKSTIEIATEKRRRRMQRRMFAMDSGKSVDPEGNGVVILAHSLGNLVLRYFFDWLLNEVGMNHFHTWVDKHIYMYVTKSNYSRVARVTFRRLRGAVPSLTPSPPLIYSPLVVITGMSR